MNSRGEGNKGLNVYEDKRNNAHSCDQVGLVGEWVQYHAPESTTGELMQER